MSVPEATGEFLEATRALGIELDPADLARIRSFLERLYLANDTMNLTRVPVEQAWTRHVFDSLTLVPSIASMSERRPSILDVGSGGGLPGVPLAIVLSSILPEARLTMLEATGKKSRFLEGVVRDLALTGVRVVQARAETAAHDRGEHRERYDAVVSRAVGRLSVLVELTLPFAKPGGVVIAIKGEKAMDEVEEARHAIGVLGGAFVEAQRTPTGTLVRIEKVSRTPRTYPRPPGEPSRKPLLGRRARSPRNADSTERAS